MNIAIKRKVKNVTMVYIVSVLYQIACIYGHDGLGDIRGGPKGGIYDGDHGHSGHDGL